MSIALLARDEAVAIGGVADVLARIADPDVHLAIWRRSLPEGLGLLAARPRDRIRDIDAALDVASLADKLPALLAGAGHVDGDAAVPEIEACAHRLAALMTCVRVRLRLEVVETDGCRRFHADYVTARLLMTIAGAGTQWIRAGTDDPIEQLQAGDVALFKGRLWAPEPAILHRSPPIAGTGTDRLLLAIDPADDVAAAD